MGHETRDVEMVDDLDDEVSIRVLHQPGLNPDEG